MPDILVLERLLALSHMTICLKQVTENHEQMSTQPGVSWTQRIFSKSTLLTWLDASSRILQEYLHSIDLIFSLNNSDGRTDNLLTKLTGWEGQEVLEDRTRISMNLANYSQGKESDSKDMLSLCRITNITNAGCGITGLIASLYKQTWWLVWITNQTGVSHATTKKANSTGGYIKRNLV